MTRYGDELIVAYGRCGVRGVLLEAERGAARGGVLPVPLVGDFQVGAGAVLVTSGGIGGNLDLVRAAWPERLGTTASMVAGVPAMWTAGCSGSPNPPGRG